MRFLRISGHRQRHQKLGEQYLESATTSKLWFQNHEVSESSGFGAPLNTLKSATTSNGDYRPRQDPPSHDPMVDIVYWLTRLLVL